MEIYIFYNKKLYKTYKILYNLFFYNNINNNITLRICKYEVSIITFSYDTILINIIYIYYKSFYTYYGFFFLLNFKIYF